MRKTPQEVKYFALPNNAENIGIVFLILQFKKVLGLFRKTVNY
jgi:hypothetical protein